MRASVAFASLFLTASIAAAQQARVLEDTPVPRELAVALLALPRPITSMAEGAQIWVTNVPQNITRQLYVPSNARLIGGAGGGTTSAIVVAFPQNSEALRTVLRKELGALGWTAPPMFSTGGGFRNMPAALDSTSFPYLLCQGNAALNITQTKREPSSTTVVFAISSGFTTGTCTPFTTTGGRGFTSPFPAVYHPADVSSPSSTLGIPSQASMACQQSSTGLGGSSSTSAIISSTMTNDALVDHYAKQLRDSGWTPLPNGGTLSGRTFTKPDSLGRTQELTITSRSSATANCRELNMQVRAPRP